MREADFEQEANNFLKVINAKSKGKYHIKKVEKSFWLANEKGVIIIFTTLDWSFASHLATILSYINSEEKAS